MGTKIVLFGEMSSGLMKQKYNCLATMTIVMFGGKAGGLQAEEHNPNHELRGCSIILWECFAAGGTGALQSIWHNEEGKYVDILKQHLKTSVAS